MRRGEKEGQKKGKKEKKAKTSAWNPDRRPRMFGGISQVDETETKPQIGGMEGCFESKSVLQVLRVCTRRTRTRMELRLREQKFNRTN